MKRLYAASAVVAAVMLLASGQAWAVSPAHAGHSRHTTSPTHAGRADARRLSAQARFVPLGARLAGAVTVTGHVYDSAHAPWRDTPVQWYAWSAADQSWYYGDGTTAADGSFGWSDALPTDWGEVWAYPDAGTTFARTGDTWVDGNSYDRTLYPGRVSLTAYRGGPWGDFTSATVRLMGSTCYSKGTVAAAEGSSTPVNGSFDVLGGAYPGGSVEFFWDEGLEFSASFGVTPGADAGTLTVDEQDAQRVWLTSPYWYSGKPGATVTVALDNFPAGWINQVTGYTDDPAQTASRTYGAWTSQGTPAQSLKLTIPSAAKPGYAYWVGFQHVDASGNDYPLYLEETYQVATMKASRTSVRKGSGIRLTGVVPTEGHWGSQAGVRKTLTVYAHKGKAPAPTVWNPTGKGWIKLGSVRTNGCGAYTTPYFHPPCTCTLIVRYPGDGWYLDAYTSPQTVKVR